MPPKRQSNVSLLSGQSRSRKDSRRRPSGPNVSAPTHGHLLRSPADPDTTEPPGRKRRRIESGPADGLKEAPKSRREVVNETSESEEDLEGGSDSEGNEWRLGQIGSGDDDSDIDSDEAFGEDDEEKYSGFAFRGSSSNNATRTGRSQSAKKGQASGSGTKDVSLEEDDEFDLSQPAEEEDDLGEGAVDLATMLDESDGEEGTKKPPRTRGKRARSESSESGDDDEDDRDSNSTFSASDDEPDDQKSARLSALQDLVASLQPATVDRAQQRHNNAIESKTPSEFGLTADQKLTVADLLPSVTDPSMKRSLKLLAGDKTSKAAKGSGGIPGKLEVPLAKRQQDRIDRAAAYEKSKQTLDRWIDTVKHNRRAEHLSFPMGQPEDLSAKSNAQLPHQTSSAPQNELENTIQNILTETGLSASNSKDEEKRLKAAEELESRNLPLEEVQARRVQLRMARELLFREEARAKRIKKIKSKSYRRVHRKQRQRAEEQERAALDAAGVGLSDEEESRHRRRAEERMGARHRESKWAKGVKASGRAAWDDDTRAGMSELARRGDELTQRVQGKAVRRQEDDGSEFGSLSDSSSSGSESEGEDGQARKGDRLKEKLDGLGAPPDAGSGDGSSLSTMKFMQRAEAVRAKENDDAVKQLQRELAGEASSSEEEVTTVGRRLFGPRTEERAPQPPEDTFRRNEFEEREESEDEPIEIERPGKEAPAKTSRSTARASQPAAKNGATSKLTASATKQPKPDAVTLAADDTTSVEKPKGSRRVQSNGSKPPSNVESWPAVTLAQASDSSDSEDSDLLDQPPPSTRRDQQDLRLRAFAGDDVEGDFADEKKRIMEEEDDQVVDKTLPGWGSWTGEGVSKRQQQRNKGRVVTKIPGVAPERRRDAKLDRVIMNERRVKKNSRYLASSLPHPFENRQQYERSLRLPVGPEWTTKETFQTATKPRVMVKQGIIAPLKKPLV